MFCSQCGKKLRDNMLFCPFCGAEIVIPEQDERPPAKAEALPEAPIPEAPAPEAGPEAEAVRGDAVAPEEATPATEAAPFPSAASWRAEEPDWLRDVPDWLKDMSSEPQTPPAPEPPSQPDPPMSRPPVLTAGRPPRISGSAVNLDVRSAEARHYGKAAQSAADSLFMDRDDEDEDDYDEVDDPYDEDEDEDEDDLFEDPDRPSFLFRHLRSVVGLLLFLILAVIVAIYAFSAPGQRSLARANLAWRPEVYSRLGKESYQAGNYAQAGQYYERALSRAPGNYGYASSAAKCYLDGGNTAKAAEMLMKCIALQPNTEDPYVYLLGLYPDAATRPIEVTRLITQGYQLTGSARLNLEASN